VENLKPMTFLRNFSALLLLLGSVHLMANTVEMDSAHIHAHEINDVVITSSKDGSKLKNPPASISVLTPAELTNWNVTSIKDISAAIPNLFFPDYGSKLTSPVYIRGIGSKINAPSVGLYVDGIPYFDKSVFDFEFDEVERIEVLRGPQGTLYGRNTMGGIIQVTTKNPLESQGGKVSLTGGSYGRREVSASYYGKISPVFGYSFSGKYNHSDGFFVNQHTGETADKLNVLSGSGKLVWKASKSLDFSLHVRAENMKQNGYPYALVDSTGKIGQVNYDSVSYYNRNMYSSALVIKKAFSGFLLKSVTAVQTLSDLNAIDQDFSVLPSSFVTQKQNQNLWTEELEAHSKGWGIYKWLVGAFAFKQTTQNNVKVNLNPLGKSTAIKDFNIPTKGLAFYHQSILNLLPGFSVTAGIRFDHEISSQAYLYKNVVGGVLATKTDTLTNLSFSQWSPKLSLQYTFNPNHVVYSSVSKGYKTGGFNTSFSTNEEQTFKPEFSWNYEAGYKFSLFENRVHSEIALFYTDWRNQQISQPMLSGVGSLLRNAGRSYSYGSEFTMNAQIAKGWNSNMSYGYTEAKFVDYHSGLNDYSDNYIPYVPWHTFMLGSDYTFLIEKSYLDKAIFSCQYMETGKLYWNDSNLASQKTYGTLNGKVSLWHKNLKLDLWVKNATNTDYKAYYFELAGNKTEPAPKKFAQKGKPTTLGATLTVLIP